jgi:hypothetical protein
VKTTSLLLVVAATAGLFTSTTRAASKVTPGLFQEVATGVALIKTFDCKGRVIGQGTGFLVGDSVVMTARHVLRGSCSARVTVAGERFSGQRWIYWTSGGTSGLAEDLATLKLDRAASGYVFRIRPSIAPAGSNLGMVGYPLGNRLSLNQGKIIWRGKRSGVPLLAVKMLGAEGASGAPFIDDSGRVVGILQVGLGSEDVLGQRTAGVLVGLDLVRWWGPRARLDLCRAYPKGGIAGCPENTGSGGGSAPPRTPSPPPSPPRQPETLAITDCWAAVADSFDPAAKSFTLPAATQDLYFNVRFNRTSTGSEPVSVRYRLLRPDGTVYSEGDFDNSGKRSPGARVRYSLEGANGLAPLGGDWTLEGTLNGAATCRYAIKLERLLNPLELTLSKTQFDPYNTYSITVGWRLLQEVEAGARLAIRLMTPVGLVYSTTALYLSASSGSEYLPTPFCSRYPAVDTCAYGAYRVEVLRDGLVVGSLTLTGYKP